MDDSEVTTPKRHGWQQCLHDFVNSHFSCRDNEFDVQDRQNEYLGALD